MKNRTWYNLLVAVCVFLGISVNSDESFAGSCFSCCAEVADGTLTVEQPLNIKNKKGELITIPIGSFKSHLKVTDKDKEIGIQIITGSWTTEELYFRVPAQTTIPTNGTVSMLGKEIGQPFNLSFMVKSDESQSKSKMRNEFCTYRTTEWQLLNGVLIEVVVTRNGTKPVKYHTITWRSVYDINFSHYTNGKLGTLIAELDGAYDVDEWEGPCVETHI